MAGPSIRVERLSGRRLSEVVPELARLRLAVFRDYPYLYDGTLEDEYAYLKPFMASSEGCLIGAFDGDRLVGASTGLPLTDQAESIQAPFAEHGYDRQAIFYFGESVLEAGYRGRGIGVAFFDQREAYARSLGRFRQTCFCAVRRPAGHPRRPPDYAPLDGFWRRRGYRPVPGLTCYIAWRDRDEARESPKPLDFWIKDIAP